MRQLIDAKLEDDNAERVRKSHADAIREIQDLPASSLRVISNVVLPDGVGVQVAHKLGRRPVAFWTTPPRGAAAAGVISDYMSLTPTGRPNDLTQTLSIAAVGFGATITVDVVVL